MFVKTCCSGFQNKIRAAGLFFFNIHVFWLVRKVSRYLSAPAAVKLPALPSVELLYPLLSCNDPISTQGCLSFIKEGGNGNGNCCGYDLSQFDLSQRDLRGWEALSVFRFWQAANKTDSKPFHIALSLYTLHDDCSGSHLNKIDILKKCNYLSKLHD